LNIETAASWNYGIHVWGGPKNGTIFPHLLVSPNINRFSEFFHR